jgi:hypothetical protein
MGGRGSKKQEKRHRQEKRHKQEKIHKVQSGTQWKKETPVVCQGEASISPSSTMPVQGGVLLCRSTIPCLVR